MTKPSTQSEAPMIDEREELTEDALATVVGGCHCEPDEEGRGCTDPYNN